MARDANGVYTLPSSVNPVVSGTKITTAWWITTGGDIATALTGSLPVNGSAPMTAALRLFAGTAASPGLKWAAETNGGLYRAGAGDFRWSIGGVDAAKVLVDGYYTLDVAGGSMFRVGFRDIPQNSQSAAYALVLADAGKHIYHPTTDASARVWTIPANASVAFPIGTAITFVNDTGGGVVTIAITDDTLIWAPTGDTGSRTLAANGIATILKMTATRWQITGVGLT